MVTLADILFESVDPKVDEFNAILQNEVENVGKNLLYRGMDTSAKGFMKIETIPNRKPRDTNIDIHNFIDRIGPEDFENKYLSRSQHVVFTSTKIATTQYYGNTFVIFVPQDYEAVQLKKDPTETFFSGLDSSAMIIMDYLSEYSENKHVNEFAKEIYGKSFDQMITGSKFNKDFLYVYSSKLYNNISSLSDIDILEKKFLSYMPKNDITTIEMMKSRFKNIRTYVKSYFDNIRVVQAPWEKGFYETMIHCEYYYAVDHKWFKNYFMFDEKQNKYVKKELK